MIESVLQDIRFTLRTLAKSPGFAAATMVSLALGIGANSAVFSIVDTVLLRPLPVHEPDRLVALTTSDHHSESPHGLSYLDYVDYRDRSGVFSGATAFMPLPLNLSSGGRNERTWGYMVSADYFTVFGVPAAIGRTFLPEEGSAEGSHPVAVLSYGAWQRRYAGDPGAIGKTLLINGHPFTIIGVTPKEFRGVEVIVAPDIWLPLTTHDQTFPGSEEWLGQRDNHTFRVWARLNPGVTMPEAQAAVTTLAGQLELAYPATNKNVKLTLYPQWEARFEPGAGRGLAMGSAMLITVVGLVLLIACANVANLLLARAVARRREIAIRLAVGSSRGRLVRQLLTESLILALLSAAAATLIALWSANALRSIHPPSDIPISLDFRLDLRVLAFTTLTAIVSVLLFGLVPALQASKLDLVTSLKAEEAPPSGRRRRLALRDMLVVAQVTLSLVLLICAGLFIRSLASAQTMDLGLRSHGTVLASVDLELQGYDKPRGLAFCHDLMERIRGIAGVQSASLASPVPLDFVADGRDFVIEGREVTPDKEKVGIGLTTVDTDYFDAIGTPLLKGRAFTPQDREGSLPVVIVNETLARQFWPGQDAIGRRLLMDGRDGKPLEIIGIAKDGKYRMYFEKPQPYVYLPLAQHYTGALTVVLRTSVDPGSAVAAIRREVAALDPDLPLFGAATIEAFLQGRTFMGTRLVAWLLGIFGLIGLTLAATGIYAVMSYAVERRTHEIGIRLALGAQIRAVLLLVVRQGMMMALAGVAIGLVASLALTRLMASLLYGVNPTDVTTFVVISVFLTVVALLACAIPARRATKVDPIVALRYE